MPKTVLTPRAALDLQQSEAEFSRAVEEYAVLHGWLCYHDYDSRRNNPGLPDWIFVRAPRVVFCELKAQRGRVRAEQRVWLAALQLCRGVEAYLWRPSDWETVMEILK